jgi:CheY-like chemotaxis protein
MDGFALIEKLRSMPETKDVPILVLSALALDDEELGRLNPLVEKFFGKGTLDLNELVKEIDRVGNLKSKRNLIGQRQV